MVDEKQYSEIMNFLLRRWAQDSNFLNGNCYWFAHILCTRFPFLKIYYDPIKGHFLAGDAAAIYFFDWDGSHLLDNTPLLFEEIKQKDPLWYDRIVRDCVL